MKTRSGRDTKNLHKFTVFSNLPPELRLRIWQWALRIPQLVAVKVQSVEEELGATDFNANGREADFIKWRSREEGVPEGFVRLLFLTSTARHSPILRVNSEARFEAKKCYRVVGKHMTGYHQPLIDTRVDCMWFEDLELTKSLGLDMWQAMRKWHKRIVRYVAFSWSFWKTAVNEMQRSYLNSETTQFTTTLQNAKLLLLNLSTVREITIVIRNQKTSSYNKSPRRPTSLPVSELYQRLWGIPSVGCVALRAESLEILFADCLRRYKEATLKQLSRITHEHKEDQEFLDIAKADIKKWRIPTFKIVEFK